MIHERGHEGVGDGIGFWQRIRQSHQQKQKDRQLAEAARWGKTETALALLDAGANIHAVDKRGWDALMLASYHGHIETAQALLKRGARLDVRDEEVREELQALSVDDARERVLPLLEQSHLFHSVPFQGERDEEIETLAWNLRRLFCRYERIHTQDSVLQLGELTPFGCDCPDSPWLPYFLVQVGQRGANIVLLAEPESEGIYEIDLQHHDLDELEILLSVPHYASIYHWLLKQAYQALEKRP